MQTTKDNFETMGSQADRSITMKVTPVLRWLGVNPPNIEASVSFSEIEANPVSMGGRVDNKGNIRLTNMPSNPNFNDNVDIYVLLDTSQLLDTNSQPVAGRWALPTEYSGTGPITGFCWFCAINPDGTYNPAAPITISGMSTSRLSDTVVLINDDTPENGPSYGFGLGLVLPAYGNYYITIDPLITSKRGTTSFMLNE